MEARGSTMYGGCDVYMYSSEVVRRCTRAGAR